MATFASLRTRLYARSGIVTASTQEEALANECLNASLAYHAAALPPQLRQVFSGFTLVALSTTVSAHSANSANVTLTSATGVFPGDVLNVTSTSRSYPIRTVAGSVLNVGVPITSSINGLAVTVTRRSLPLPTAGAVIEVYEKDSWRPVEMDPTAAVRKQFETGQATCWTQSFSETGEASYLSLFPAPTSATQFIIIQFPAFTEDADIYASEALLAAILATAYDYRMAHTGAAGLIGAARVASAQEGLRAKSSGGHGVIQKK